MATLYVKPSIKPTPEEKKHNRALFERYMPDFIPFFLEVRETFGKATNDLIKIQIPEGDLEFVKSNMDKTKRLVK